MYRISETVYDQAAKLSIKNMLVFEDMNALLRKFTPDDISILVKKGTLTIFHFTNQNETWNGSVRYELES